MKPQHSGWRPASFSKVSTLALANVSNSPRNPQVYPYLETFFILCLNTFHRLTTLGSQPITFLPTRLDSLPLAAKLVASNLRSEALVLHLPPSLYNSDSPKRNHFPPNDEVTFPSKSAPPCSCADFVFSSKFTLSQFPGAACRACELAYFAKREHFRPPSSKSNSSPNFARAI